MKDPYDKATPRLRAGNWYLLLGDPYLVEPERLSFTTMWPWDTAA